MSAAEAFAAHARRYLEDTLGRFPAKDLDDIYLVSLCLSDDHDSLSVMVGYNTKSNYRASIEDASDEEEARWNFAFWLQNDEGWLADPERDPEGARLCAAWAAELTFDPAPGESEEDFVDRALMDGTALHDEDALQDLLAEVARGMQQDGVLQRTFGRPVPVLIHTVECDERAAARCARANPNGEALQFCDSLHWDGDYGEGFVPPPDEDWGGDDSGFGLESVADVARKASFTVYAPIDGGELAGYGMTDDDRIFDVQIRHRDLHVDSGLEDEEDGPYTAEALARGALFHRLWSGAGDPADVQHQEASDRRSDEAPCRDGKLDLDGRHVPAAVVADSDAWAAAAVLAGQTVTVGGLGALPEPLPALRGVA